MAAAFASRGTCWRRTCRTCGSTLKPKGCWPTLLTPPAWFGCCSSRGIRLGLGLAIRSYTAPRTSKIISVVIVNLLFILSIPCRRLPPTSTKGIPVTLTLVYSSRIPSDHWLNFAGAMPFDVGERLLSRGRLSIVFFQPSGKASKAFIAMLQ